MWRLTTLGGLAVEQTGRAEYERPDPPLSDVVAQRRPLALLAVLAAAGERGVKRDDLLLYFWPDSDVERARNALRQTVFRLRRDLSVSDLMLGTVELRLNADAVTSDFADFEAAVAAGELERAVALYRGPFLHGVSIGDAPEFDQWAAAERARLAQRFAAAIESVASTAEARGDHEGAVRWWRRLATVDPSSSRVAVGLMTALAASGDRAGALQYYRLHELLLQEELGVTPDETVIALVNRLQPPPIVPGDGSPRVRSDPVLTSAPTIEEGRSPRFATRRMAMIVPTVVAAALALVFAINRAFSDSAARLAAATPVSSDVVMIFPFATRGGAGAAELGDVVANLLSATLDGAGALRVADRRALRQAVGDAEGATRNPAVTQAIADRYGAGQWVLGEVATSGKRVTVTATLYARGSPPVHVGELAASGSQEEIATVVEDVARQLLVKTQHGPSGRLAQSAALTTRSLPALKAYLQGERHFRNGDFGPAVEALQRAVREDTGFAMAYYRLSVVADWASHPTLPTEALGHAVRLSDALPEHDQRLVRALAAWRQGRAAEALQLYRIAVSEYPDDAEAWYQLGEVLFHSGPALGHSVAEARPAFERALQFRAGARESLIHLVRIAAKVRDNAAIDSLTRRVLAMDTTRDALEMRLFRAIAAGDDAGRRRVIESLRTSPDEAVLTAAWRVGTFAEELDVASDISRLLIDLSRSDLSQATGRWYVASLELARGRWAAARATLGPAIAQTVVPNAAAGPAVLRPGSVDAVHAGQLGLMAALPVLVLPADELAALRRRVAIWPEPPREIADWTNLFQPSLRDYVSGLLSVRAGDTIAVAHHAIRLERLRGPGGLTEIAAGAAHTLRAEEARAAGRPEEALAILEAAPIIANLFNVVSSRAYERFLRAELLHQLGRDDEALRWYATQGQSFIPDLIYLAPAHLRQAQIHELRGDRGRAVTHYRRFVDLWSECDPELRPMVDDARRRLARLGAS